MAQIPGNWIELLEKEQKTTAEYKRRYTNEKVMVSSLRARVKQLEEEKATIEKNHRKSLVLIEQKVANLKNTNLKLLSKDQKAEEFMKELEAIKIYKDTIREYLK